MAVHMATGTSANPQALSSERSRPGAFPSVDLTLFRTTTTAILKR